MGIRKFIILIICMITVSAGCGQLNGDMSSEEGDNGFFEDIQNTISEEDDADYGREAYNKGNCKKLIESSSVIVIFVDDNESNWSKADVNEYWNNNITPAREYIEEQAENYEIPLSLEMGCYATDIPSGTEVKYDGIISTYEEQEDVSRDILYECADSLGFEDEYHMNEYLRSYTKNEQIAYIIVVNKAGRSYCFNTSSNPTGLEYCVLYKTFLNGTEETTFSVIHEFFHLFGAEDLYDPFGSQPKRAVLAKKLYPNDVMLRGDNNIYNLSVGRFTAYCLGWIDELPEECSCENWWK